jgi:hypothetical protein
MCRWRLSLAGLAASSEKRAGKECRVTGTPSRSTSATLLRGTVEVLPIDKRVEAATCLFMLHFLTDAAKLTPLRAGAARLHSGATVLVASGARVHADAALRDDFTGAWQQDGNWRVYPLIGRLRLSRSSWARCPAMAEQDCARLLQEAGFEHIASIMSALAGGRRDRPLDASVKPVRAADEIVLDHQ